MLVNVSEAIAFVNSHPPIYAQAYVEDGIAQKFFIMSESVDRDGRVHWETDTIECDGGLVDLDEVRDVLGY